MKADGYAAWRLIREARSAAGLSQQALADRAGTTQSAVARYESAKALPNIDTLHRILAACGQRLELRAVPVDADSQRQLEESLQLTARQRVERNRRVTALAAKAARAHREGRIRPLQPR